MKVMDLQNIKCTPLNAMMEPFHSFFFEFTERNPKIAKSSLSTYIYIIFKLRILNRASHLLP
jgi:hypothetical protein